MKHRFSSVPSRLLAALVVLVGFAWPAASAHAAAFTQIAPGTDHVCGVRSDGTAWCWGNGTSGQLGVISVTSARVPLKVIGSYATTQISSGPSYWCERLSDGTAACTGINGNGQLGDGVTEKAAYPQPVVGLDQVSKISVGTATTCALNAGTVYCWGDGARGQIGNGQLEGTPVTTPVPVGGLSRPTDVDVGDTSVCAVVASGQVMCWGDTTDDKLGNNLTSLITVPGVPVSGLSGAKTVAVGVKHACALKTDGTVWCWGDDSVGQLGDGGSTARFMAKPVTGLTGVVQIDAAGSTTCAVKANGTAWCWGDGKFGQTGNGTKGVFTTPVQVAGITDAAQIGVGLTNACLVSKSQVPACWGSNQYSQLGAGLRNGAGQGTASPAFVVDSLDPAVFLPASRASLSPKTTSGGAIQFLHLTLKRTSQYCPQYVRVTVTAKGKSVTGKTKPSRLNGICELNGRYRLPPHTQTATTARYSVRSAGSGGGIVTRKGTLKQTAS